MNQRIKLTAAQQELIQEHFPIWPAEHVTHIDIESPEHLAELTTAIAELSAELDARPYSPDIARSKFAAKYLLRKLENTTTAPVEQDAPTVDSLNPKDLVYLKDDPTVQYRVVKTNSDGSVQVYGGPPHYGAFRDFRLEQLTTTRPKSMPKLRD